MIECSKLRSLYQTTALTFSSPLHLQANRDYELAMVNLETFKWSVDEGKAWTVLHVPTGCYELKVINAEITRIRGNSDITILPNVNTLQCILTVVGAKCKVSFDVPDSLASVLGFKQDIVYGVGRHASEKLVNGIKILEAPHNLIYLPVTVEFISTLSVWLTDRDGELLRGKKLTILFHLRGR